MRCRAAMKLVSLRLDGRLSSAEAAALDAHLAACSECEATSARVESAWRELAMDAAVPATPDLWSAIAAGVEEPRGIAGWLASAWRQAPGQAVSAAVLALVAVLGLEVGAILWNAATPSTASLPLEAVALAEAFADVPAGTPFDALARGEHTGGSR